MDFNDVLEKRHCARRFLPKDVSFHKIMSIIEAGTLAPSAGNLFSVRVIIVNDNGLKKQLAEAALSQNFITEVPCVLVVCSDPTQIERSYGKRGLMYMTQQAGAAIENMFLKTIELGLDTCWVGAFDDKGVKRILHIPDNLTVEALMPIGYSEEQKMKKHIERKKIDIKHITYFNGYGLGKKRLSPPPKFQV